MCHCATDFFILEILDEQAYNQAPFNPVLFLSVLRIHEHTIEGRTTIESSKLEL